MFFSVAFTGPFYRLCLCLSAKLVEVALERHISRKGILVNGSVKRVWTTTKQHPHRIRAGSETTTEYWGLVTFELTEEGEEAPINPCGDGDCEAGADAPAQGFSRELSISEETLNSYESGSTEPFPLLVLPNLPSCQVLQ